jgi:deazaflavin-dependent oxidoreductase (nitroreductase family)
MSDFNEQVIAEFRANGGKVGGMFEGAPMVLLHTTGASTGLERVHPLMYQQVGDEVAVFASNGGGTTDPVWYRNLTAEPSVTVEIGNETVPMTARVAAGEERTRIWEQQKSVAPQFAEYERTAEREIPVVLLSR